MNVPRIVVVGSVNTDMVVKSPRLPLPGETLEEQYTQLSPARIDLFCQILRTIGPDVVQINGLMPTMVRACNALGVRHVVVAHHPGEVCPKGDLLTPEDAICTAVPGPSVCGPCVLRCKKGGLGIGRALALMPMGLHRWIGKRLARSNPLGYLGRVLYIPWMTEQQLLGLASYQQEAQTIVAPSRSMATALVRAGAPALGVRISTDADGELLARSNTVLKGYWNQPEATEAALAGGWFHTGDGGVIDDEHYVTVVDRKKDVIISGGENVSSIEVEDALFGHPAVIEAAVIGVPNDKWGETVKALVVLDPDSDLGRLAEVEPESVQRTLIAHCREVLAHYKCPTSVEVRTELERTATGKLQKYKLRAPYWEGRERQVN